MFETCDESFIRKVVECLRLQVFLENDTVVQEGEPGEEMFFVRQGIMEVTTPGGGFSSLGFLKAGSFFGEIAILASHTRRLNSVISLTKSELYSFARDDFVAVLIQFPENVFLAERALSWPR